MKAIKISSGYLIFTPIFINGKKYNALVDTGASVTLVSKKVKRECKLSITGEGYIHGFGKHETTQYSSVTISSEKFEVEDAEVEVLNFNPHNNGFSKFNIRPIDVILGTYHIALLKLHIALSKTLADVHKKSVRRIK